MTILGTQNYAYQNTPPSVPFYIRIRRPDSYTAIDLTQVTTVTADVYLPGAAGAFVLWTFTPVPLETTKDTFVGVRTPDPEDTASIGKTTIIATMWIGSQALPPGEPVILTIRKLAPR